MSKERFVESMGRFLEGDGLPRIGGRLFGYMLLEDEPHSLDELAERLQVSKTSVSTNARLLERGGLVERVSKPGDRRDYYVVTPDPARLLELRLKRARDMEELLTLGLAAAPAGRATVRSRLARLRASNTQAIHLLSNLLGRVRPSGGLLTSQGRH